MTTWVVCVQLDLEVTHQRCRTHITASSPKQLHEHHMMTYLCDAKLIINLAIHMSVREPKLNIAGLVECPEPVSIYSTSL